MKTIRLPILLLPLLAILNSCDIINPEEPVPAYLEISPFSLTTDTGSQGSASEKITEVWVFVDGVYLGMYDLPALVPVIKVGPTEVRLEAGIRDNGISATPDIYPFYESYSIDVDLQPNQTVAIDPVTSYSSSAKFAFIEDFEDNRPRIFTETLNGNVALERTQGDVFEGIHSGTFSLLREDRPVVEIVTGTTYGDLQVDGVFVYLEVNYKSDVPVFWGVIGGNDPVAGPERFIDPGFAPKDEWNKIYFNISQLIFDSRLSEYQVGFQAILSESSPDSANVLLDNIKLVHF